MKLVFKYVDIFLNFSPTSSHLHPLQVENCDSNSRLVVDEDDDGKVRRERVNTPIYKRVHLPLNGAADKQHMVLILRGAEYICHVAKQHIRYFSHDYDNACTHAMI